MKKITEHQIVSILKEAEAGIPVVGKRRVVYTSWLK
jgi:hypothetical protein